jgi:hypothetical protein
MVAQSYALGTPRRYPHRGSTVTEGGSGSAETAADATERPVEAAWTGLRPHDSERSSFDVTAGLLCG